MVGSWSIVGVPTTDCKETVREITDLRRSYDLRVKTRDSISRSLLLNRTAIALILASSFMHVTISAAQSAPAAPASTLRMDSTLPTDERLVTGVLDNGLRYIVIKHSNPVGRASVRLFVSTGSLNETDAQRGIAHFLEHMAFNGSQNFAPGTVINFFQSLGMQFGRDQNASTGFDRTTYMLDLPDTKPETIGKATLFFSDVAGKLLLSAKEIDDERQIILEEKRTRDSAQWRSILYTLPRMMPGSLYGQRLPIGVDETIKNMTQKDFQDYYRKWYVPSNMTVVAAGDCDPQIMVDLIKKDFSGGAKVAKPQDQDLGMKPTAADSGVVFTDKELAQAQIQIMKFEKPLGPTLTVGDMRREMVGILATRSFDRVVESKVSAGKMSFLNGGVSTGNQNGLFRESSIACTGKAEDWQKMLTDITTEVRRTALHGLSARDVDSVKAEILASAEQSVKTESTASAAGVLSRILAAVADDEPVMSPQQQLDVLKQILPTITTEECSKEFASAFEMKSAVFMLTLPAKDGVKVPSEAEFQKMAREAMSATPAADSESKGATELLSKAPAPGKFAEISEHPASHVFGGWLENGVRFNYRFMDYKKNSVTVSINVAGATLHETAANRGISEAAGIALSHNASSTLGWSDIRDLMSGKKVDTRGGAGMDNFSFSISGSPEDLEDGFKVAYLMLTDAKIEDAAFDQWKTRSLQLIETRKSNPMSAFAGLAPKVIFPPSEVRTTPLTKENIDAIKLEDAQKWLTSQLATSPMEVTVVGDVDRERAMDLVAKYLGSLPKRERISNQTFASERKTGAPAATRVADVTLDTKTDQAVVAVGFDGPDMVNVADVRAMNMAVRVLNTRMIDTVREKEQLVYSPRFTLNPATVLMGTGSAIFVGTTDPHKVDRLVEVLGTMFDEFNKTGPTQEELTVAQKQFAASLEKDMKEPAWWASKLNSMTYRGSKINDMLEEASAMEQLTASQVLATFNKYYKGSPALIKCIVRPAAGESAAPAQPAPAAASPAPAK